MRRLTSAWLLGVVGVQTLFAPEFPTSISPYLWSNWQVEDGLPNNSVTSIEQASPGYLWFSTFSGLVRFNGLEFKVYSSLNIPGLNKDSIAKLFIQEGRGIWLSMADGALILFNGASATPFGKDSGWPGRTVGSFALTSEGTLLVGTTHGELYRFQSGRFARVLDHVGSGSTVRCVRDAGGSIWISERNVFGRLIDNQVVPVLPRKEAQKLNLDRITPARDGGIWVAANGHLRKFAAGRWVADYGEYLWSPALMTSLKEDSRGNLWVATWGHGLYLYAKDGEGAALTIRQKIPKVIRSIYEDQEGSIWIGSDARGLIRLKLRTFYSYSSGQGLERDQVMGMVEDARSDLWIANKRGGIVRLDAQGIFHKIPARPFTNRISAWSILADSSGRIWAGTYGQGLFQATKDTLVPWPLNVSLPSPYIRFLFQDQTEAMWIGTEGGLTRIQDGKIVSLASQDNGPMGPVISMAEQADGTLWFGTDGQGLHRLQNGRYTHYSRKDGLSDGRVSALLAGRDGILWIGGSQGGLNCFREGHFRPCPFGRPLQGNSILALVEDENGNLWLGTNRGVMRIDRQELEAFLGGSAKDLNPMNYGKEDGLASSQISPGSPSAVRDRDGRLWFATFQGLSGVDPAAIRSGQDTAAPVAIEEVWIGGNQVYSNTGLNRPASNASTTPSIDVPPGHQRLEIHFAVLRLAAPNKASLRYRLEGFSPEWNDIGGRREAYFQGLLPGTYHFQVQAANGVGAWTDEGARLAMVVQPFLWQTWWMRLAALLALGGAVFWTVQRRYLRLRDRQQEQQAFARQLMESQETERKRIAAGLHDSLGQYLVTIRNTALMEAKNNPDPTGETSPFLRISTITGKALDEIRTIIHSLRPEEVDRLGLKLAIESLLLDVTASQSITIESDLEEVAGRLNPEQEIQIYRIIQEGLNNMLKHAQARTGHISLKNAGPGLHLTIKDDGRGFDPHNLEYHSGQDSRHGQGLRGMKERVNLIGGQLEIHSHPSTGTSLNIVIPLTNSIPRKEPT